MILVGFIHFRSVDTIRYPIFRIDEKYFYMYKDKKYKINIPENFVNKFIDVVLSEKIYYVDYEKERKEVGFPKVYKINGIKVINKGEGKDGDIDLPINF